MVSSAQERGRAREVDSPNRPRPWLRRTIKSCQIRDTAKEVKLWRCAVLRRATTRTWRPKLGVLDICCALRFATRPRVKAEGEGRGWKRRAGADPELESESESVREKKGAEECTRGRKSFDRHDAVAISEAAMQYAGLNEAKRQ